MEGTSNPLVAQFNVDELQPKQYLVSNRELEDVTGRVAILFVRIACLKSKHTLLSRLILIAKF
jgi:hypothetical protein